jgi:hypothetical protein
MSVNQKVKYLIFLFYFSVGIIYISGCTYEFTQDTNPKLQITTISTPIGNNNFEDFHNETKTVEIKIDPNNSIIEANLIQNKISSLLTDNGGCKFPCIWGITPGKTSLQDAKSLINDMGNTTISDKLDIVSTINAGKSGNSHITLGGFSGINSGIEYAYLEENNNIVNVTLTGEFRREYNIVFGDPVINTLYKTYLLSEVLKIYGNPTYIYIKPYWKDPDAPRGTITEFKLFIIYLDKGFLVEYILPREEIGEYYIGCPTKSGYFYLLSWDPKNPVNFKDHFGKSDGIFNVDFGELQSIEEATNMNISGFTEFFTNGNNSDCIQTPKNKWKLP